MNMNYAINLLEREIHILEKCLNEWESENHPEAKKDREIKLNQLREAVLKLKG